jgi:hypothetical protein
MQNLEELYQERQTMSIENRKRAGLSYADVLNIWTLNTLL